MRFNPDLAQKHFSHKSFVKRHSLSIVASVVLGVWIVAYILSSPDTHVGSFFGNAIADWTGLVFTVIGTKYLFERGSRESRRPHDKGLPPFRKFIVDHSLTIFLVLSGAAWVVAFGLSKPQGKWGQVLGNIVSEWTQLLGLVLLTKRFIEPGSKS